MPREPGTGELSEAPPPPFLLPGQMQIGRHRRAQVVENSATLVKRGTSSGTRSMAGESWSSPCRP